MKFLNLTPHALNIINKEGQTAFIPRHEVETGRVLQLRAATTVEKMPDADIFEVSRTAFGKAELITTDAQGKDPQPFTGELPEVDAIIASQIAMNACGGFWEGIPVYAPGTLIRNAEGQPIGAQGLTTI